LRYAILHGAVEPHDEQVLAESQRLVFDLDYVREPAARRPVAFARERVRTAALERGNANLEERAVLGREIRLKSHGASEVETNGGRIAAARDLDVLDEFAGRVRSGCRGAGCKKDGDDDRRSHPRDLPLARAHAVLGPR